MSEKNTARLSPPWYTFFNFLKHSVGEDRCVEVLEMRELSGGKFLIEVDVKDRDRATAMATILLPHKNFGNIDVCVEVSHCGRAVRPGEPPRNAHGLARLFEEAFCTNCYFERAESVRVPGGTWVFPVFAKTVIQFFNDDISDLYSNFNGVAADVFAEVLRLSINGITVNPSTAN